MSEVPLPSDYTPNPPKPTTPAPAPASSPTPKSVSVGLDARTALRRQLDQARTILLRMAAGESVVAFMVGGGLGLFVCLLLVGWLPFSVALRIALLITVLISGVTGASWVIWRRYLPSRTDAVIADRLEEASIRRGAKVGGAVRGAVELMNPADDAALGRSRVLCDAYIASTADEIREQNLHESLPAVGLSAALPTLLTASGTMLLFGIWLAASPDTLKTQFASLFSDEGAQAAIEARAKNALPLVTDITLAMRFPAYMKEPDQTISGASGDIVAPRGTEVIIEGRADRSVSEAFLLLGDKEIPLTVREGRQLSGQFTVDTAGSYRFKLVGPRGGTELDPVAHRITIKPDEAPVVDILAPTADEVVQLDDVVKLAFHGKDDYGLTRFRVVVRRQGSSREPYVLPLVENGDQPKEFQGKGEVKISDTGARPGDRLSVYIEADDNNTVPAPSTGRSATRVLTVFSPAEHHQKLVERQTEFLERMVNSLADELETPMQQISQENDLGKQLPLLAAHDKINQAETEMMTVLDEIIKELAADKMSPPQMRTTLVNIRTDLRGAVVGKRTNAEAALGNLKQKLPVSSWQWRSLQNDQNTLVAKLEKHILYLEDLLNTAKLEEARQIAEDMRRTQQTLQELLDQYRKSPDDDTRRALLDEIESLRQDLKKLMERLATIERDIPDEYFNQESFKQEEILDKTASLDQLIEEGKLDEAADMLNQMIASTEDMIGNIEESQEDYGGEEYAALREKLDKMGEDLEATANEQKKLLEESEKILDELRKQQEQRLGSQAQGALAELKQKVSEAKKDLSQVPASDLRGLEREEFDMAKARLDELQNALEQGDIDEALRSAEEASSAAQGLQNDLDMRLNNRFLQRSEGTQAARDQAASANGKLDEVRRQLNQLAPDPSQLMTPEQKQRLQQNAQRQNQLAEKAQKMMQSMDDMNKEAPLFGPSQRQSVSDAQGKMHQAGSKLSNRDVRGARQHQQDALKDLQDLGEQLKQQKSAQNQGQNKGKGKGKGKGRGMPMPMGGGNEAGNDGAESQSGRNPNEEVKIPDGSDFRVPDAYRKDILDAMRENAPESWSDEVKRYYEELIKQ